MIHINQMVSELKVQPEEIRSCCALLELEIDGNQLSPETAQHLKDINKAALSANISLVDATKQVVEMRNAAKQSESGGFKFDARSYIKQRFGKDPENESKDSFVGILYRDMPIAYQLGDTRFMSIIEVSTHVLRDRLTNGISSSGCTKNAIEFSAAQDRALEAIDVNFFENINWGEGEHPVLLGALTQPQKQLNSSNPKTSISAKNSPAK
jgi:hypothetical protein